MFGDVYKLEGTVKIPEDKKAEFNQYILRILKVCGIRKTERIKLGGQTITVVRQPVPDEQGIVRFDYSIFEKKRRKIASYYMKTCELMAPDRGYNEFGVVMNMIMVMLESYSEKPCYFIYQDRPCSVNAYALLIRDVLGISLKFPNRSKMWDMFLFFKNRRKYQNVTSEMIWNAFSVDFCDFIPEQFFAVFQIDSEMIGDPKELFERDKSEVNEALKGKFLYYVYQNITEFTEQKETECLKDFLRKLLDADLQKRQELAKDIKYGRIAVASLYVLPPVIVLGYALAVHQNFWDVWKELGIKGYSEIITEKSSPSTAQFKEDKSSLSFYKAIHRDYEDEFIEFWEDENLHFSDDMRKCLSDWKAHFANMSLEEEFNMETFLIQIVTDLYQDWDSRLVDQEFITEFMEHREDDNYKKALLFYRELIDESARHLLASMRLPINREMPGRCFLKWIEKKVIWRTIRNHRHRFEVTALSAFPSLFINHKHRFEVLGF